MNYLWPLMIIAALLTSMFGGNLNETLSAGMEAAKNSVTTVLTLGGMMCFWSGILEIAENGGISSAVERFLRPVTCRLFPKLEKGGAAMRKITSNIAANILGMGNAATPAGIAAMSELDKINPVPATPSDEMCIFIILNTASIQIVPTTIISLRAAAGAAEPAEIMLPMWIASFFSLVSALITMKVILKFSKKKE